MRGLRVVVPLLLAVMALVWWQQLLLANRGTETAVDRPHEAIILPGDTFADWLGISLEELALYRYRDGVWEPVSFQIDEVDETGSYVAEFDGLLGASDELVFMSADSGTWVSPTLWVSDSPALQQPRYVITITDPLQPEAMGWVYLYRSTTLPRSDTSYVNWDNETQAATAVSYTLSFTPDDFLGLASLSLNDQPQHVLDRQKLRLDVQTLIGSFLFNEETILDTDFIGDSVALTLPITGPVRAIGGSDLQQTVFYGQQALLGFTLSLDELPFGTTVNSLRLSLDLADPEISGLAPVTYYDSNLPASVTVDGSPDAVPQQPLADWQQIDGVYGGFVSLLTVSADSGQTETYYLDDATLDPDDTGDGRSYGDAGFFIANPDGLLQVQQSVYFLAGQQGNRGQTFAQQAAIPLQTNSSQQPSPIGPDPSHTFFLPFILLGQ